LKTDSGALYAAMVEAPMVPTLPMLPLPMSARGAVQLLPLNVPGELQRFESDQLLVSSKIIYLLDVGGDATMPATLRLVRPGGGPAMALSRPAGNALILPSAHDDAFVYIVSGPSTRSFFITRTDGSFERQIPLPTDVQPDKLFDKLRLFFDDAGTMLFTLDGNGHLIGHKTTAESDIDLGQVDSSIIFTTDGDALLICGMHGLQRVPIDGSAATVFDAAVCKPDIFLNRMGRVIYGRGESLYTVSELGGTPGIFLAPPENQSIGQLLSVSADFVPVYSLDPPQLYGAGIGDGWISGQKYMERGRRPSFFSDQHGLRWLENAARSDNTGELMSVRIPKNDDEPLLLAKNVRQFSEMAPAKVLCISNAESKGTYNRLILVDETAQVAHYVVDSARAFLRIPDSNDVLVEIVNGQIGYDIRRVPVPL
jgi:hypothetical protein